MKVLVLGTVDGSASALTALANKIRLLHGKHGPFDVAFCFLRAGAGASASAKAAGESTDDAPFALPADMPLPVYYVTVEGSVRPEVLGGSRLKDSPYLLASHGVLTLDNGLRVAYIGGKHTRTMPNRDAAEIAIDVVDVEEEEDKAAAEGNGATRNHGAARNDDDRFMVTFDEDDLKRVIAASARQGGVDLLLTSAWPETVMRCSHLPFTGSKGGRRLHHTLPILDDLSRQLKPRYHFAVGEEVFFQREPYRNRARDGRPMGAAGTERGIEDAGEAAVTRFVGLADFGNAKKERWFYAMAVTPMRDMSPSDLAEEPAGTTDNPYIRRPGPKRGRDEVNGVFFEQQEKRQRGPHQQGERGGQGKGGDGRPPPEGYVCRICSLPGHFIQDCPTKPQRDQAPKPPPDGYICNVCKQPGHYIRECPQRSDQHAGEPRSQGDQARRSKIEQKEEQHCWFCLANPDIAKHLIVSIGTELYLSLPKGELVPHHLLLVTVDHTPDSTMLGEEGREEYGRYKKALMAFFEKRNLDVVFYETHFRAHHMNVQIIPVPRDSSDKIKEALAKAEEGLELVAFDPARHSSRGSFFRIELPNGEHLIYYPRARMSLQMGRQALANVLEIPDRVDWKVCRKSTEEETADAVKFKRDFKEYDFTLE